MSRYFLLLLLAGCTVMSVRAQSWTIKGRVLDADTREGLPFSNVYFPGTTTGVATDLDGYYEITTRIRYDSLSASALGYDGQRRRLSTDSVQTIDFYLTAARFDLQEIVVLAGENPANAIVRGIIKNKRQNRLENLSAFQYESYAKVELDLENIDEKLRNSRLLKPFDFIFEAIDSTSDEKPFLPVYINEVLEDVYYAKGAGKPKGIIRAQRNSGTDNPTIVEYIKKIHAPFSIYDNWIYVLEKAFISPFADGGLGYYEYYIIDSTWVNGHWSYKLKFKPKRRQEATFYGDFWVADTSFAVQRVNMRMSPDVNINLVQRIIIYQEFEPADSAWLPVLQKMIVDFSPGEKTPGMIGRRTETFRNFMLNNDQTRTRYLKTSPEENLRNPNFQNEEAFWQQARHVPLTTTESTIYALVDSIKNVPAYKTYTQIVEIIVNGYLITGSWELGPYGSVYGINPVEGHRFRLGARTSTNFNKDFRMGGYVAYGLQDAAFKYGADFIWIMSRYPRTVLGGAYKNDISLNSESSEDFAESDFFSGTLRRNIPMKLIRVEEAKLYYERHWNKGFSNRITLLNRRMDPYGGLPDNSFDLAYLRDTEAPFQRDSILTTTEFIFKTRFAYDEIILDGNYERVSGGTRYPIIELQYGLGIDGLLGGNHRYHRVSLSYRHYVNINPVGWLSYRLKAGKVFGQVPFLLMEVHPGNEGFFMARGIFNTMNRYEFASDTYAQLVLEHHFDGFFFNKVPLLRRLKWREVVSFKAVTGSVSDDNLAANQLNLFDPLETANYNGFRAPARVPYMEAGVGIENILKIIRIDALWRLNYMDNPQAKRFHVVGGFYFFF
ncbi:MAG TPA: DUF5686 family protein [Saprospiraceae bacterium]|nr:DUF5686 family protein [Saprospiraceae bacterium]HMP24361.1 DUF5686 family protein [Saprospiraceae bacterium]